MIVWISLLALSALGSVASTLLTWAMVSDVNRKRDVRSQMSPSASPFRVFKEYRTLYPKGFHAKALVASIGLTAIVFLALVYLILFVVHGPPSR